jgi:MFS family permease
MLPGVALGGAARRTIAGRRQPAIGRREGGIVAVLGVSLTLGRGRLRTFSALRHRNYRLYWFGMLVAIIGWQVQMVAQAWLVYEMTDSTALLGLVGLTQAVPTIVLTLFGGVVADRVDRRRLIMATQAATGLLILLLATLVVTDLIRLWHIFAIALLVGAVWAFDQPARMALIPHLVEREDLMNAVAMGSMVWQSSRIVGPAIAGVIIGLVGIAPCFYLTTAGMLAMVFAVKAVRIPRIAPPPGGQNVLQNLAEGIRYILANPIFSTLIGLTFFNSLFGMSYVMMLPVFARDVLAVGSEGYGVLMGISGVGALLGTMVLASLGDVRQKGLLMLAGATAFGSLIILFALSRAFPLSLALLFLMGAFNSAYMTTVNTLLQSLVPDELRGRVMGIYGLTWSIMPVGGFLAGAFAAAFAEPAVGAPLAIGLGGALVAAMALMVAATSPRLRRI